MKKKLYLNDILFTFSAPINAHALAITLNGQKTEIELNKNELNDFYFYS